MAFTPKFTLFELTTRVETPVVTIKLRAAQRRSRLNGAPAAANLASPGIHPVKLLFRETTPTSSEESYKKHYYDSVAAGECHLIWGQSTEQPPIDVQGH